jgi:hypothetical protein
MSQFSDEILNAIVNADAAWVSPSRICVSVQCPPDLVQGCIDDLERQGMVARWDAEDGPSVTLTPLSAEKLGVHIDDDGRWVSNHLRERAARCRRMPDIDFEEPDADTGAFSAMAAERIAPIDENSLPFPTVLIGSSTTVWDNVRHAKCPACGGRDLKPHEYCIFCDAWGGEKLLEKRRQNIITRKYRERRAAQRKIRPAL